jgi:hypothetical protein
MSKQTAVEWLENQLKDVKYNRLEKNGYTNAVNNLYTQAKQMEKEQIKDAIFFGMQKGLNVNKVPETDNDWVNKYYNETYGGQDEH